MLIRATDYGSRAFMERPRGIRIEDMAEPGPFQWVVEDVIPSFGMTVLFGAAEAAKTYTLMDLSLSIGSGLPWLGHPAKPSRVLWVDYESGEEMFNRRIRRVVDGNPSYQRAGVTYFPADGIPFPDLLDSIRREVLREDIGLIVVDHVTVACGGRPEDAEIAGRYGRVANALSVPSVHIAHITGEAERDISLTMRPFGSVFWKNLPRGLWFAKKSMASGKADPIVQLWNRKQSDGLAIERLAHQLHFTDPWGAVSVESCEPPKSRTAGTGVGNMADRIWDVLEDAMLVEEIADILGAKPDTVHRTLTRGEGQDFRNRSRGLGGAGHTGMWERMLRE